jgi:superfamily II DNA or RNA helicase
MPRGIYSRIVCQEKGDKRNFNPQPHQTAATDYFARPIDEINGPFKGFLLYHKLGSGKTCTAYMISDRMLEMGLAKHVYVFSPGSVRQTWISEYCNVCGKDKETLKANYTFVTYNYAVHNRLPNLTNSLVIIDEVHNLINGVKNISTVPTAIFNLIKTTDCRVLVLSGTPVYNFIYEFALLGALLKPGSFPEIRNVNATKVREKISEGVFLQNFYTDENGNTRPKNEVVVKDMFKGIISYFPGNERFMPKITHMPPIKAVMTQMQEIYYWDRAYIEAVIREPKDELKNRDPITYDLAKKMYIVAKKRIFSRAASNFFYPCNVIKATEIEDALRKSIGYVPDYVNLGGAEIFGVSSKRVPKEILMKLEKMSQHPEQPTETKTPGIQTGTDLGEEAIDLNLDEFALETKAESAIQLNLDEDAGVQLEPGANTEPPPNGEIKIDVNNIPAEGIVIGGDLAGKPLEKRQRMTNQIRTDNIRADKDFVPPFGWIQKSRFNDGQLWKIYSTKITTVMTNIVAHINQKHVLFTFFKNKYGAYLIYSMFKMCKVKAAVFSGNLNDEERRNLLKKFNAPENDHGEKIRLLIVTKAGAEGISLFSARHFHILEMSPRISELIQAIGRIARYRSHERLPEDEREVKIWYYWSVSAGKKVTIYPTVTQPDGTKETKKVEIDPGKVKTIDEKLYDIGMLTKTAIDSFNRLLQENSVT